MYLEQFVNNRELNERSFCNPGGLCCTAKVQRLRKTDLSEMSWEGIPDIKPIEKSDLEFYL